MQKTVVPAAVDRVGGLAGKHSGVLPPEAQRVQHDRKNDQKTAANWGQLTRHDSPCPLVVVRYPRHDENATLKH